MEKQFNLVFNPYFNPYSDLIYNIKDLNLNEIKPDEKQQINEEKNKSSRDFFKTKRNKYLLSMILDYLDPDESSIFILLNSLTVKAFAVNYGEKFIKELKNVCHYFFLKERLNDLLNDDAKPLWTHLNKKLSNFNSKFILICINLIGNWLNKFFLENPERRETQIDLNSHSIDDLGSKFLGKVLFKNRSLITLNLPNNKISTHGLKQIFIGISFLDTLEELNISSNRLTLESLEIFTNYLKNKKNLRFLNLAKVNLGDSGVIILSEKLKYLDNLETLFLDDNQINSLESIRCLVNSLITNKKLLQLSLSNNELTDCWGELKVLIEYSPSIQHLNLSFNKLKNIHHHHNINNTTLVSLNLDNNFIGIKGIRKILIMLRSIDNLMIVYLKNNFASEMDVYNYLIKGFSGYKPTKSKHFEVGPFHFINQEIKLIKEKTLGLTSNIK